MSKQLDIVALEPFYGGVRRMMLETIVRCSRHRWKVYKLPPRRLERRLTAAAFWFAEQLSREAVGRFDLLFVSEAMNLANLHHLTPKLGKIPSVVYFHDNQLPSHHAPLDHTLDMVNLNSASAASEIWFNSLYHLDTFLSRAAGLVQRHRELASLDPMSDIAAKARLMPTPVDMTLLQEVSSTGGIVRDPHTIFVETDGADMTLLAEAISILRDWNEPFKLIVSGPVDALPAVLVHQNIRDGDEAAYVNAMLASGIILSVKPNAPFDLVVIKALQAGCRPVLPFGGAYPEILPEPLHKYCLYEVSADALANSLRQAMNQDQIPWPEEELHQILHLFDASIACRAIDQRLDELTVSQPVGK